MSAQLAAVLCSACGGAVAMEAGRSEPRCLFCGSEALEEKPMPEGVEAPTMHVPFAITSSRALAVFGQFARSGFFRPSEFARANPALRQVYMTAWAWSGVVETHWAALVPAATRSGKRPVTGHETQQLDDVLTPAASALTRAELAGIAPYSTEVAQPIPPDGVGLPYEVGTLTRSVATGLAREQMRAEHERRIASRVQAVRLRGAGLVHALQGRPFLLPAWVGTVTYRGRVHRYVINGQTGRLHGKAPVSPWRVLAAIVGLGIALAVAVVAANS